MQIVGFSTIRALPLPRAAPPPPTPPQGLAVAQLLGFPYRYHSGFSEDAWLRHLPREVAPGLVCANASEVARACQRCADPNMWEFAHGCDAGWTRVSGCGPASGRRAYGKSRGTAAARLLRTAGYLGL